jgi:hypothetical protein
MQPVRLVKARPFRAKEGEGLLEVKASERTDITIERDGVTYGGWFEAV